MSLEIIKIIPLLESKDLETVVLGLCLLEQTNYYNEIKTKYFYGYYKDSRIEFAVKDTFKYLKRKTYLNSLYYYGAFRLKSFIIALKNNYFYDKKNN